MTLPDDRPFHHHAVQFYGTDVSLFSTVSGFLADGLVAGQPALVIATPEHVVGLREHLRKRVIDLAAAETSGQLRFLDAEETLAAFMLDGTPDPFLFERHIGGVMNAIREQIGRQSILRAYGEMVDVLWRRGDSLAAIQLEILWNTLALKHQFALLCGYSMGSFYKQTHMAEAILEQHTDLITEDPSVSSLQPKLLHRVN